MSRQFIEKYRRKSLLFMLVLIFRGRAKYVTMTLLVVAASVPFVATSSVLNRLFDMPPISKALRMMGISSVVSTLDLKYNRELVRAAIERAAEERAQTTYWDRMMAVLSPMRPCGAGCSESSLAMVQGKLYSPGEDDDKKRVPPDQVAGAANPDPHGKAAAVNLAGRPPENPSAIVGEFLGEAVESIVGEAGSPYIYSSVVNESGGTIGRNEGIFSSAVKLGSAKVPLPKAPRKVNAGGTGKVSGFAWNNMRYKTKSGAVEKPLGNRRAMFQLAETFSATNAAYISPDSNPEYQDAYVGSTYDGNEIDLDIIVTDQEPTLPDYNFMEDLSEIQRLQKLAEDCAASQKKEGVRMAEIADEMDDMQATMTNPPMCYGNIGPWNAQVAHLDQLCQEFNRNQAILSKACQTSNDDPMGCGVYQTNTDAGGMIIKKCKKPSGPPLIFLLLLLIVLLVIAILAFILLPLIVAIVAMISFFVVFHMMMSMMGTAGGAGDSMYKPKTNTDQNATGTMQ
jgi:hypothetical protein